MSATTPEVPQTKRRRWRAPVIVLALLAILVGWVIWGQVAMVREGAYRINRLNSLKQLSVALSNYQRAKGHLPPPAIYDAHGRPLLSWRVLILSYLDQEDLFKQFRLTEPWDSEHNKNLLERMPRLFEARGAPPSPPYTTHFQAVVGPGAAWEPGRALRMVEFRDVHTTTILLAESPIPVPWTQPADIAFDPDGPLPAIGVREDYAIFAAVDTDMFRKRKPIDPIWLRAAITRAGGEKIDLSF